MRGRQGHSSKSVAAQELAIQNAGAIKAGGLNLLDESHELRHWGCTGNAERNAYGRCHVVLLCGLRV